MYCDIGAYDMIYSEYKEICHEAWSEKFNYLCNELTKIKNEGKYRIFNESKTTYIECIPESEPFLKRMTLSHKYSYMCNYKSMNKIIITRIRVDHIFLNNDIHILLNDVSN